MVQLKVTKDELALLSSGTRIITHDSEYLNLPFWYKKIGEDLLEILNEDEVPTIVLGAFDYLTKKGIEELGFAIKSEDKDICGNDMIVYCGDYHNEQRPEKVKLFVRAHNNVHHIIIRICCEESEDGYIAFNGAIKNKSELEQVLKMVIIK